MIFYIAGPMSGLPGFNREAFMEAARLIRQKSVLRRLIRTCSDLAARCYDAPQDIDAPIPSMTSSSTP